MATSSTENSTNPKRLSAGLRPSRDAGHDNSAQERTVLDQRDLDRLAARARPRPPKRRWWLWTLGSLSLLLTLAPRIVSLTPLRALPLQWGLSPLNGSITCRGATLGWLVPVQYDGIEIRDAAGQTVVALESVTSSKPLWQLALNPTDLGTFTIRDPNVTLVARDGTTNLEEVLQPYLAAQTPSSTPRDVRVELQDGKITIQDQAVQANWTIEQLQLALTMRHDAPLPTDWTAAGQIPHAGRIAKFRVGTPNNNLTPPNAAALSPENQPLPGANLIQISAEQVPLEMFRWALVRGLGEVKLAGQFSAAAMLETRGEQGQTEQTLRGELGVENLLLSGGRLGGDQLQLARVRMPLDVTATPARLLIRNANLNCDLGQAAARGSLPLSAQPTGSDYLAWLGEDLRLDAQLQLAALARQLPKTLSIHPRTQLTRGLVNVSYVGEKIEQTRRWSGMIEARDIAAVYEGKPITVRDPIKLEFAARDTPAGPTVEKLSATARFMELNGAGTWDDLTVSGQCDLDQFTAELGQFLDLSAFHPAGTARGNLKWKQLAGGAFSADLTADLQNFQLQLPGQVAIREPQLTIVGKAAGSQAAANRKTLDSAEFRIQAPPTAGATVSDQLFVRITQPLALDGTPRAATAAATSTTSNVPTANLSSAADDAAASAPFDWSAALATARFPVEFVLQGELTAWQARLGTIAPLKGWQLAGLTDLRGNGEYHADALNIAKFEGRIQQAQIQGPGLHIQEELLALATAGSVDLRGRGVKLTGTVLQTAALAAQADTFELAWPASGPLTARGAVQYEADLTRLQLWFDDPQSPANLRSAGRLRGSAQLSANGAQTRLECVNVIDKFTLTDGSTGSAARAANARPAVDNGFANTTGLLEPFWSEPELRFNVSGQFDNAHDLLQLEKLEVASQALTVRAAGKLEKFSTVRPELALNGKLDYDWQTLSPALRPYLGESVKIVGRESRAFEVHGPLAMNGTGQLTASTSPLKGDGWSATTAATPRTTSPATDLAAAASNPAVDELAWLQPVSANAALGWEKIAAYGFDLNAGALDLELRDGLVSMKPLDIQAGEGKIHLAPQLRLSPGPQEMLLPRETVLEKVRVTPEIAASWLKFVAPLLSDATRMDGTFSLDVAGGRVPLTQPLNADITGRLRVQSFAVTPGEPAKAWVLLAQQIAALVDKRPPPLQLDQQQEVVLLKMEEQAVDFRVVDGRVYHQGLLLQVGKVTLKTQGWVSLEDETLGMLVEIPLLPEWIQKSPALAKIPEQTIKIPMTGTLKKPQVDREAIGQLTALLIQNAAQQTIENQLNKGLDRLLRPR